MGSVAFQNLYTNGWSYWELGLFREVYKSITIAILEGFALLGAQEEVKSFSGLQKSAWGEMNKQADRHIVGWPT